MNNQARQDSSDRFDEITCPNDTLKCFGKSAISNIQTVEFSPQGNLLAVGCRNQSVLILDFVTMAVMRIFSLQKDYGQAVLDDVD
jgi:WD40 repeat protein